MSRTVYISFMLATLFACDGEQAINDRADGGQRPDGFVDSDLSSMDMEDEAVPDLGVLDMSEVTLDMISNVPDTGMDMMAIRDMMDMSDPITPTPLKAFPNAWGAGSDVTGGRGGQVIHVTTLDWNAPGGLREAITTPGPRTVVFDVSGEIDATSESAYVPIIEGNDYNDLTIAGQTAPEGGITIRTTEFMFSGVDNVILRYLRFRQDIVSTQDAMWMTGVSDIIVDHCSFSHGGDESASIASSVGMSGAVTIQRSFFQDSKTGTILGVDDTPGDFTYALNLVANIAHRFPNPKGEGHYDIINNVVYNWQNRLVRITGGGTYNIVNNVYKSSAGGLRASGWFGETGDMTPRLHKVQTQPEDSPQIYTAGSIVIPTQRPEPMADDRDMFTIFDGSHLTKDDPVPDEYFVESELPRNGAMLPDRAAAEAYQSVIMDVGANRYLDANGVALSYVDTYDAATLQMVQDDSYSGEFYDSRVNVPYPTIPQHSRPDGFDTDRDGMPDAWELAQGFDPGDASDHALDADADGYTNLEEYLNGVDR